MTGVAPVLDTLLESLDFVWARVRGRIEDVGDEEYRWEPVAGCWTVHPAADLPEGRGRIDRVFPDPEPAPVTTIAWRTWHIAVECLDGYSRRAWGDPALDLGEQEWFVSADDARHGLDAAWAVYRKGLAALGEEGLRRMLGPDFGPYAESDFLALALHTQDEVSHHGAEIALLRDLYRTKR